MYANVLDPIILYRSLVLPTILQHRPVSSINSGTYIYTIKTQSWSYLCICCSVLETSVCSRTHTFKLSVLETSFSFYVCLYNISMLRVINKFILREKRQGIVNSNN